MRYGTPVATNNNQPGLHLWPHARLYPVLNGEGVLRSFRWGLADSLPNVLKAARSELRRQVHKPLKFLYGAKDPA